MKRLALVVLAAVSVGCSGPSLEGTWDMELAEKPPVETTVKVTFSRPDRMVADVEAKPELPGVFEARLHAEVWGDWKLSDGTLTVNAESITVKDTEGKDVPDVVSDIATSTIKDALGKSASGKVLWEGNDKFTVTLADGKKAVFTRTTFKSSPVR